MWSRSMRSSRFCSALLGLTLLLLLGMSPPVHAQSLLSEPRWSEFPWEKLSTSAAEPSPPSAPESVAANESPDPAAIAVALPTPYRYQGSRPSIDSWLPAAPEQAARAFARLRTMMSVEEQLYYRLRLQALEGDSANVRGLAESFLRQFPYSRFFPQVLLLVTEFAAPEPAFYETWESPLLRSSTRPQRLHYWGLRSQQAEEQELWLSALRYRLEQLRELDTESAALLLPKLRALIASLSDPAALERLLAQFPDVAFVQERAQRQQLITLMAERRYEEVQPLLATLLTNARSQNDALALQELQALQRRLDRQLNIEPYRIGVLLPMTSRIPTVARLSQQTIEGLRVAIRVAPPLPEQLTDASPLRTASPTVAHTLSDNRSLPLTDAADLPSENATTATSIALDNASAQRQLPDNTTATTPTPPTAPRVDPFRRPRWELVFRDTELSPEKTRQAFRELVEEENVIAVMGPLARRTSEAAAEEAEAAQVPMISFSLTTSVPDLGSFVFRNNLSWEQEIVAVLDYATQYLAARRFVVLYPDSREGREKVRVFWEMAREKGLQVQNIQSYVADQNSYVDEFESFTGIRQYRTDEEDALIAELKERAEPRRDFDAVFLIAGDQTQDLEIIIPYLEVYGLDNTLVLGDSGWNDARLLFAPKRETLRRAVFTGGFFPRSEDPDVQEFRNLHLRYLHRYDTYVGPTAYAAYAYDTTRLLMQLLLDPAHHDPVALRDALLNHPPTKGVTGRFFFQPNGEVRHQMTFWTIKKDRFAPVELP